MYPLDVHKLTVDLGIGDKVITKVLKGKCVINFWKLGKYFIVSSIKFQVFITIYIAMQFIIEFNMVLSLNVNQQIRHEFCSIRQQQKIFSHNLIGSSDDIHFLTDVKITV